MPPAQRVQSPVNAAQECPALQPVKAPCNLKCIVTSATETAQAYNECRARHKALIDWATR